MPAVEDMNDSSLTPTTAISDNEQDELDDQPTTNGNSSGRKKKVNKARLSAQQKNTNHKDAENKRRSAIRERFTELSHMIPDAKGQERSETVMLQKTAEYLQRQLEELRHLEEIADQRGVVLNPSERLKNDDFGGKDFKQPHMKEYRDAKLKKGESIDETDDAHG